MATLEKRVERLETERTERARRTEYTPPDPAEQLRRADRFIERLASICRSCGERTDDGSGLVFVDLLKPSCHKYALLCKTFSERLRTRIDNEGDKDEKHELMEIYRWVNGPR